jgi:DNA mismatch repair protein MutS2
VNHPLVSELDLDTVLTLVAAHTRTRAGRLRIVQPETAPAPARVVNLARLTREVDELLQTDGALALSGIDQATVYLEPSSPPPVDPVALLDLLGLARRVAAVRRQLRRVEGHSELLEELGSSLPDTEELVRFASTRLGRDGQIPDSASADLARLRRRSVRVRQQLMSELEGVRRSRPDAVADAPPTVRRDRYCVPVKSDARATVDGLVLATSGSGATLYMEPFSVVALNNDLADAISREAEEVQRLLAEVAAAFAAAADDLRAAVELLADLDAAQARALFGRAVDGRVVVPGHSDELVLREARHPLLDERLQPLRMELFADAEQRDPSRRVVPLDFRFPPDVNTVVVSGPNAGGKTMVLKTIGLMVMMAYQGIPLPVGEGTTIPFFEHSWCHIGDDQDVAADLSTFSAAMAGTAALLDRAGPGSLVLYDELGSGTDPLEGAALGCATLEELARRGSRTVATTHLAAIAMAATSSAGMDNAAMDYDEEHERPLYTLRLGRPGRSRGLEIAGTMGVPAPVLDRARSLLGGQHLELDRWLRRLEQVEGELQRERTELEVSRRETLDERRSLEQASARLERDRGRLPQQLAAERDRLRRRAKSRLDQALKELDEATREHRHIGRRQRQRLRDEALDLGPDAGVAPTAGDPAPRAGDPVVVTSLGATGVLEELRGSRARVRVGANRLWVGSAEVRSSAARGPAPASTLHLEVGDDLPPELNLLGMDSESARDELERYLDRALAAGRSSVRVVHGHGTGVLRRMVQDTCRHHPAVRSFRHPPQSRGGSGATEVSLAGDP